MQTIMYETHGPECEIKWSDPKNLYKHNPLLCRLTGNRCLYAPLDPPSSLLYVPLNGNKFTERVPVINVIGLSKFLEYFFFYAGITYLEQKHFFSSGLCVIWFYICTVYNTYNDNSQYFCVDIADTPLELPPSTSSSSSCRTSLNYESL